MSDTPHLALKVFRVLTQKEVAYASSFVSLAIIFIISDICALISSISEELEDDVTFSGATDVVVSSGGFSS